MKVRKFFCFSLCLMIVYVSDSKLLLECDQLSTETYRLQSECCSYREEKICSSWDYDKMWTKTGFMKVSQKQQWDSNGIYVWSH